MKAVDLFSGWGGFTLGAQQADIEVVYAANHWPLAVEAHAINHPNVLHECQDLRQADWGALPDFDILLASPSCKGASEAGQPARKRNAGAKRRAAQHRATAHAVIDCVDICMPTAFLVENVVPMRRWDLYEWWKNGFRILGYDLQEVVLRASHHGVPQRRDRLFIVGTRNGVRVNLDFDQTPEPAFGDCIDWKGGDWRPWTKARPGKLRRMQRGRERHGRRFIVQDVTGHRGIGLHEPIRTITTKDQWGVVNGDLYRPLTVRETARAMGFPGDYGWPEGAKRGECIEGLGNAVCPPVARDVVARVAEAIS